MSQVILDQLQVFIVLFVALDRALLLFLLPFSALVAVLVELLQELRLLLVHVPLGVGARLLAGGLAARGALLVVGVRRVALAQLEALELLVGDGTDRILYC